MTTNDETDEFDVYACRHGQANLDLWLRTRRERPLVVRNGMKVPAVKPVFHGIPCEYCSRF